MRRSEVVKVPAEWGRRDAGKMFMITEKPATAAEKWAWRLFIAVKGTTAQIPPELEQLGMVGVAIRGINSFLAADVDFAKIEPLLDEMMECVKVVRDPAHPELATDLTRLDDVEEAQTVTWLRNEVLRVHTNFSFAEQLSRLISAITTTGSSSAT
jgi:hypothetical protein